MKVKVIVNDLMQNDYIYYLTEPMVKNFHSDFKRSIRRRLAVRRIHCSWRTEDYQSYCHHLHFVSCILCVIVTPQKSRALCNKLTIIPGLLLQKSRVANLLRLKNLWKSMV